MYDVCFATQSYKRKDHKNTTANYKLFMRWLWLISIHTSGSIFVLTKRNVKIPTHIHKKPVNILLVKEFKKRELFILPCYSVFYMDFNVIISGTITSYIDRCNYMCQIKNSNSIHILRKTSTHKGSYYLRSANRSSGLYLENITIPSKWGMYFQ